MPDVVIGVGGVCEWTGVIHGTAKRNSNPYSGAKFLCRSDQQLLSKKALKICVAYPDMEKFFPSEKIVYTGNPVRKDILELKGKERRP